ncbi:hypothetical protein AAZX31_05G119000 [Glycine max]
MSLMIFKLRFCFVGFSWSNEERNGSRLYWNLVLFLVPTVRRKSGMECVFICGIMK